MRPGETPELTTMADNDLFIVSDAATKKTWTHKLNTLLSTFRSSLTSASTTAAGLMTPEQFSKLESLYPKETMDRVSLEARTEHVGLIIRQPALGAVRMFRNLRGPGVIRKYYAETGTGTMQMTLKIDGKDVVGAKSIVLDSAGTGLKSVSEANGFNTGSVVEAHFSNLSTSPQPQNISVFLVVEYNW